MKKTILLLAGAALIPCLAGCNGKSTFKIEAVDPVIPYSQIRDGFKLRFTADSKFVEEFKMGDVKLSCDKEDKMTFTYEHYSSVDLLSNTWNAYPTEAGTYKVAMTINGFKSPEIVLTVKESQYAKEDLVLPDNIKIDFKVYADEPSSSIYKIGNSAVEVNSNGMPIFYVPDITKEGHYTNKGTAEEPQWVKRTYKKDLFFQFCLDVRYEYISKKDSTINIGGTDYKSVCYDYGAVQYEFIKTDNLAILGKIISESETNLCVTGLDTSITSFPESFKLPK